MVHTFSRGLSEIVLMVEDVLKAAQFYRDVVGLVPCTEPDDTWAWFWAGPPGVSQRVGLHKGALHQSLALILREKLRRDLRSFLTLKPHAPEPQRVSNNADRGQRHRGRPKQRTGGLLRRRFALLRTRRGRPLSSCRHLCRSHSPWRETGRSPGAVSDKI